jgi:hypothetical protein
MFIMNYPGDILNSRKSQPEELQPDPIMTTIQLLAILQHLLALPTLERLAGPRQIVLRIVAMVEVYLVDDRRRIVDDPVKISMVEE